MDCEQIFRALATYEKQVCLCSSIFDFILLFCLILSTIFFFKSFITSVAFNLLITCQNFDHSELNTSNIWLSDDFNIASHYGSVSKQQNASS